jgi:hypothetical protein
MSRVDVAAPSVSIVRSSNEKPYLLKPSPNSLVRPVNVASPKPTQRDVVREYPSRS